MDRAEAARLFAEARRLYEVAELVHARRIVGGIDSAVLAHRSLWLLLRLFVRLRGEPAPDSFAELVARAQAITAAENLMAEESSADLQVLDEMRGRFVELVSETTPADERRYDRAFVCSAEWFSAVRKYLDQRLPPPRTRVGSRLVAVFGVGLVFAVGVAVGKHVRPEDASSGVLAPTATTAPSGPTFACTFYRDTTFRQVAFSRRDATIAFDWGDEAPAPSVPVDHFSARWEGTLHVAERGKYVFYLTSDDGSRLFLDGSAGPVVDNWGAHSTITKSGEIDLQPGDHALRVEYFDEVGAARVKLEWAGPHLERRLVTGADLR